MNECTKAKTHPIVRHKQINNLFVCWCYIWWMRFRRLREMMMMVVGFRMLNCLQFCRIWTIPGVFHSSSCSSNFSYAIAVYRKHNFRLFRLTLNSSSADKHLKKQKEKYYKVICENMYDTHTVHHHQLLSLLKWQIQCKCVGAAQKKSQRFVFVCVSVCFSLQSGHFSSKENRETWFIQKMRCDATFDPSMRTLLLCIYQKQDQLFCTCIVIVAITHALQRVTVHYNYSRFPQFALATISKWLREFFSMYWFRDNWWNGNKIHDLFKS